MSPSSNTGTKDARLTAIRRLNRIEESGAFVGLISGEVTGSEFEARDERHLMEYVAGVTRWRRWLDFLIDQYYRGSTEKLEPVIRQILRLGIYELLFLSTPPHAAVNEAVQLTRKIGKARASGLVNGLLRTIERHRDALPEPDTDDRGDALAIRYSHPTWMVRRWISRFGPDQTQELLEWNNKRPVHAVRVNVNRITSGQFEQILEEHAIEFSKSDLLDYVYRIPRLQPLINAGLLADGLCVVQDESAALVVRLLDPQPGETLIDACAAPGGKTLHAAMLMQNAGRILAYDIHPGRLSLVEKSAESLGTTIIETKAVDLRKLGVQPDVPTGDRILLDAPCSGLGVLSRRADLRWNRIQDAFNELTELQDELLDAAARLVKPGGLLVYSTCTIEPEENEARVSAFLDRNRSFHVESSGGFVPDNMITPEGFFATLPHRHGMDGAFGARLRREGGS